MINSVLGVLHIVYDIDKMVFFYTQLLGFKEVQRIEWKDPSFKKLFKLPDCYSIFVELQLGKEALYLLECSPSQGTHYPKDSCSNDLWFQHIAIVVSDMKKAHTQLMKYGVEPISTDYQTIPQSNAKAAGIQAFYFRSPEGHPLELIYFPPDKGNPRWHNQKNLFLGIDHTALAVSNTAESLKFYRDMLGMQIVGSSLNYGKEQEQLSGVPGAKVQITTLQFPNSNEIGIEFLEYLHPLTGRVKSPQIPVHSLNEVETIIAVEDLDSLIKKITKNPACSFTGEPCALENMSLFKKVIQGMDPDQHRILLVEKKFPSPTKK